MSGCRKKLAQDQWWNFCGETDFGSVPALCTCCGGEYILADDPDAERKVAELNVRLQKELEVMQSENKKHDWVNYDNSGWQTTNIVDTNHDNTEPKYIGYYTGDGKAKIKPECLQPETLGFKPSLIWSKQRPSTAQKLAKTIRESVDPFELGLSEEQTKQLREQINEATASIISKFKIEFDEEKHWNELWRVEK